MWWVEEEVVDRGLMVHVSSLGGCVLCGCGRTRNIAFARWKTLYERCESNKLTWNGKTILNFFRYLCVFCLFQLLFAWRHVTLRHNDCCWISETVLPTRLPFMLCLCNLFRFVGIEIEINLSLLLKIMYNWKRVGGRKTHNALKMWSISEKTDGYYIFEIYEMLNPGHSPF